MFDNDLKNYSNRILNILRRYLFCYFFYLGIVEFLIFLKIKLLRFTNQPYHRQYGSYCEIRAAAYLVKHQLILITKNYRSRYGEIDLIMQDTNGQLVFVEVRARKIDPSHHLTLESINQAKCQRIRFTAQNFIASQKKTLSIS